MHVLVIQVESVFLALWIFGKCEGISAHSKNLWNGLILECTKY